MASRAITPCDGSRGWIGFFELRKRRLLQRAWGITNPVRALGRVLLKRRALFSQVMPLAL
jgi:hypothetical protein